MAQLSFNSTNDYSKFKTVKTGAGTYTLDSTNKTWTLDCPDTVSRSNIYLQLKNVTVGDIIEVEYEIEGTGQYGVILDRKNVDFTTTLGTDWKETFDLVGNKKGKIILIAKSSGNYEVIIGAYYGIQLSAVIKNLAYTIRTSSAFFNASTSSTVDKLIGIVAKDGTGGFVTRATSPNACTVAVDGSDANNLILTFSESLTNNPVAAYVTLEWDGSSYLYTPRISYKSKNSCKIRFYNASGAVVPIASIATYVFLTVRME